MLIASLIFVVTLILVIWRPRNLAMAGERCLVPPVLLVTLLGLAAWLMMLR